MGSNGSLQVGWLADWDSVFEMDNQSCSTLASKLPDKQGKLIVPTPDIKC